MPRADARNSYSSFQKFQVRAYQPSVLTSLSE